jgi:predicted DNA-binding transcriptional regulator YafY
MKEFLKTNTVTHNLMAFTGFKSILLFTLLSEGPKSYAELKDHIKNHEYLHEEISTDTLRIYINSLKEIGCKIEKKNIDGVTKYFISTHPFELKISDKQVKSIIKIYKAISKTIEVTDLISLHKFFQKISNYVQNEDLKIKLKYLSPLNDIDIKLVEELIFHVKNQAEITVYYNSPRSGLKNITILADKIAVNNGKLYLYGMNSEYKNYSSFLVSKIVKILSVSIENKTLESPDIVVQYEYTKDNNENLDLLSCEKVIEEYDNKCLIELTSKSKFDIIQRILYHNYKCKVLSPQSIKTEVIQTLKQMKEGYIGE